MASWENRRAVIRMADGETRGSFAWRTRVFPVPCAFRLIFSPRFEKKQTRYHLTNFFFRLLIVNRTCLNEVIREIGITVQ